MLCCPPGFAAGRAYGRTGPYFKLFAASLPLLGREFGKAFHQRLRALAALAPGLHDAADSGSQKANARRRAYKRKYQVKRARQRCNLLDFFRMLTEAYLSPLLSGPASVMSRINREE